MKLSTALKLAQAHLDYEQQSGRMDEETTEAFDTIMSYIEGVVSLDPMEQEDEE